MHIILLLHIITIFFTYNNRISLKMTLVFWLKPPCFQAPVGNRSLGGHPFPPAGRPGRQRAHMTTRTAPETATKKSHGAAADDREQRGFYSWFRCRKATVSPGKWYANCFGNIVGCQPTSKWKSRRVPNDLTDLTPLRLLEDDLCMVSPWFWVKIDEHLLGPIGFFDLRLKYLALMVELNSLRFPCLKKNTTHSQNWMKDRGRQANPCNWWDLMGNTMASYGFFMIELVKYIMSNPQFELDLLKYSYSLKKYVILQKKSYFKKKSRNYHVWYIYNPCMTPMGTPYSS